jgi:hypothetical protein
MIKFPTGTLYAGVHLDSLSRVLGRLCKRLYKVGIVVQEGGTCRPFFYTTEGINFGLAYATKALPTQKGPQSQGSFLYSL